MYGIFKGTLRYPSSENGKSYSQVPAGTEICDRSFMMEVVHGEYEYIRYICILVYTSCISMYIRYRYMYISCIHICIYVLSERNAHPLSSHENHCQCHVGTRANMLHRVANGKERNGNHLTCKVGVQKKNNVVDQLVQWPFPLKNQNLNEKERTERIEGASNIEVWIADIMKFGNVYKHIYIYIFVCILSL